MAIIHDEIRLLTSSPSFSTHASPTVVREQNKQSWRRYFGCLTWFGLVKVEGEAGEGCRDEPLMRERRMMTIMLRSTCSRPKEHNLWRQTFQSTIITLLKDALFQQKLSSNYNVPGPNHLPNNSNFQIHTLITAVLTR